MYVAQAQNIADSIFSQACLCTCAAEHEFFLLFLI